MNKWIEINRELPPVSHNLILITNKRGWVKVVRFLNSHKHGREFFDAFDSRIRGFGVTHWLPIPEVPCKN